MEGLRKVSVLLLIVATLRVAASHMDSRTGLHIPEKIIGGVIDIVHSHKNKPVQTTQQYPGQNYQYPQYQQWNQQGNYQGQAQYQGQYQGQQNQLQGQQNQIQSQMQGQNQGQYYPSSYPQNNAPVPTYPQPTYPVNTAQYPVQSGASQNQVQGQYQYPQNAGQFQGQNQQGNGQYQGQMQQQNGYQTGQNQYPSQTSQFQGQNQSTGQYTGQELSSGQFQVVQGSGGAGSQANGFQVTGGHSGNQGPACVCQAWTKPNTPKEAVPAIVEKTDNTEM